MSDKCAVNGNHYAEGHTVEAVMSPKDSLPEGAVFSMSLCEEHIWPAYLDENGKLLPGKYYGVLHVLEEQDED